MSFIISPYQFGTGIDADAQAFITAADITDATTRTAIIDLVASLKSNSLWTKFIAIYPMVADKTGGTNADRLAQIKVNLKSPGTFDLTYTNAPTASATGLDFDGSTQFATTGINPSLHLSQNDAHISVYLRENVNGANSVDIGNTADTNLYLSAYYSGVGGAISNLNNTGLKTVTNSNSSGFYVTSRTSSANRLFYRNGSLLDTFTATSVAPTNVTIVLAQNGGTQFSPRQQAWASMGSGLSGAEVSTLNTIVEAFQDALSRGVQ